MMSGRATRCLTTVSIGSSPVAGTERKTCARRQRAAVQASASPRPLPRCAPRAEVPLPATVESPVDEEEGPQEKSGEPEKWLELGLNTVY